MGEDSGRVEKNLHVGKHRKLRKLRPWKRHSLILMVAGFLYVLIGALYIRSPATPARNLTLKLILEVAPIQVWGSLFVLSGLLSMLSSRWPPASEKWGYVVLTGMSSGWSATYLLGVLFFGAPSGSWSQVVIWATLAFLWWAISGLANPGTTAVIVDEKL